MELITTLHHESGRGIHAKSVEVNPKDHIGEANEMVEWFDATNGHFKGENERAYGIAHCQVTDSETPLKLFVVDKQLVKPDATKDGKQSLKDLYFEAQAIWNAEILEKPHKVKMQVPQRRVEKVGKEAKVHIDLVEREVSNEIEVKEGCMSYPHRRGKYMRRFHTIKVRYQYITKTLGITHVKTFEGWVEGLKAHILQHEVQHQEGKTMYFQK
jgi:hypothetical protein